MIEKGRHKNMEKGKRVCPFCKYLVEDEMHFLLKCPIYIAIREEMKEKVVQQNFFYQFYSMERKFIFLMNNGFQEASRYILKSMDLRDLLLSTPKQTS